MTLKAKNPGQVRELILYVSDDLGVIWKRVAKTTPDSPEFPIRVARDGEYWFAVQTVDVNGKLYPVADQIEPTARVVVDSTKPAILLEPAAPSRQRGRRAGGRCRTPTCS